MSAGTGEAGIEGFAPVLMVRPIEREIYKQLWQHEEYRSVAPGESCVQEFLRQARPKPGSRVIDFGCGTGRAALSLAVFGNLRVVLIDFADNCLDADIRPIIEKQPHAMEFVVHDLMKGPPLVEPAPYGFCTDVMEHVPPTHVDVVLDAILKSAQHVFFQISTTPDVLGDRLVGLPLHLSVHPYEWWLQKFQERDCLMHWSRREDGGCQFYVTAWQKAQTLVENGVLNTELEQVRQNVKHNIAQGYQQCTPHATQPDAEVLLLGGGPTLNSFVDEIREKRAAGAKLVTLNNAYKWALEHDMVPSAQVMVDARPFNVRFVQPWVENCKYLLASQCDPSVLEAVPKEHVYLWHTSAQDIRDLLREQYADLPWFGIPGGSTVLLRAIPLLRMLGFRKFHLYGCDSCLDAAQQHHAYVQQENDGNVPIPVSVSDGRTFYCHGWMIAQAQEFMDPIRFMGDDIELAVYGDGLLAHILNTGAQLCDEQQPLIELT